MARRESRPENRGSFNLTQEGVLDDRDQHCQSASSAYDLIHGRVQAQPAHAAKPHSSCKRFTPWLNVRPTWREPMRSVASNCTFSRATPASATATGS